VKMYFKENELINEVHEVNDILLRRKLISKSNENQVRQFLIGNINSHLFEKVGGDYHVEKICNFISNQ